MKFIKRTLLYVFSISLALLVLAVVVNLPVFDEALLPEVKAIQDIKAEPYGSDNAYPAMLAFSGPPNDDFIGSIRKVRELLNQKVKNEGLDYLNDKEYDQLIRSGYEYDYTWRQQTPNCSSRREKNCIDKYLVSLNEDLLNNPRLLEMLTRYAKVIRYTHYSDPKKMTIGAPIVAYGHVLDVKKVYLLKALVEQNPAEFIDEVLLDLGFWRRVLIDSHLMISKMIAVASISDTIQIISLGIRQNRFSVEQLNTIQSHITLLSPVEMNMGETFRHEFKYGMEMVNAAEAEAAIGWTSWINFFQPKASHNANYEYFVQPATALSKKSAADVYDFYTGSKNQLASPVSWSPTMLYNPTGKLMLKNILPAYQDYFARMHDLNGMVLLLKLQIETVLDGHLDEHAVIAGSKYKNPYTAEPMIYDATGKIISFACLDKHSVCEIRL